MSNEIMVQGSNAVATKQQMSVPELMEQVQIIQQVMRNVMKENEHYGKIAGCGDKPTLLKPGAEKIGMVFHIGSEPEITRESDGFDTHFHIRTRMFQQQTGITLGYGVGEGSTSESKWAWRKAVCTEEFEATPETRRRVHWQKKYRSDACEAVQQVRQNPADIINTVLKMAIKRAEVDGIRKVTACSDVFAQDLDEDHIREAVGGDPEETPNRYQQPQRKPETAPVSEANPNVISDGQRKRLFAIGKSKGLSNDEMSFIVYNTAGVDRSDDIARDKYESVVAAFEAAEPGKVIG